LNQWDLKGISLPRGDNGWYRIETFAWVEGEKSLLACDVKNSIFVQRGTGGDEQEAIGNREHGVIIYSGKGEEWGPSVFAGSLNTKGGERGRIVGGTRVHPRR